MTYAHMIYYFQTFFTSKCVFLPKVAALFDSLLLPPQYYSSHGRTSYSKSYSFHGRTSYSKSYYSFHGRTSYSKAYYSFSWRLPTLRVTTPVLLQRPVNCQPCYWAPNSQSRKRYLKKKNSKILIFFQKPHFSKNSANNKAPPKQSLLTSFIRFVCITFYASPAFLIVTGTLRINFEHYSLQSLFFTKSRCFLCQCLTKTPSKLSTLLLGAQLLEQEAKSHKKITFPKFCHFFIFYLFQKTATLIEHLQNKVFLPHLLDLCV